MLKTEIELENKDIAATIFFARLHRLRQRSCANSFSQDDEETRAFTTPTTLAMRGSPRERERESRFSAFLLVTTKDIF